MTIPLQSFVRQPKTKHHWTAAKKRAAKVVDMHRSELAEALVQIAGLLKEEDEKDGVSWYIPDRIEINVVYIENMDGHEAVAEFEDAVTDALQKFLEATR